MMTRLLLLLLAQQPAPADSAEPVVLDVRLGRIASRTVAAYRVRSEALVPLGQFLELAEVKFEVSPQGVLAATLEPGQMRLVVDATIDTVAFGPRRVRLEPGFRRAEDGEVYVGAERLGDLLGLQLHVDWTELTVTVLDPSPLPLARRLYRESARRAFLRRGDALGAEVSLGMEHPQWDGLVFDYSFLVPTVDIMGGASYAAALGGDALGGSLQLGVRSEGPLDSGQVQVEGSWTGVWHHPALAQIRIGTGITTGPRARQQHGLLITNAPFVRPSDMGAVPYVGRLEPGWSVEAYRGGDLVAYDSADGNGRYLVDLPVRYGENPVDFVAYGPFGEIRQFNRTYRVLQDLLPGGRFEYGVSGGACTDPVCDAIGNVDLRYGVTRRWTLAAGADRVWRDSQPDLFHPYVALTGSPTNDWGVALEAVGNAFARAAVQFEPSLALHLGASATRFAPEADPYFTIAGRQSQWAVSGYLRPAPQRGYVYFEGLLEGETTNGGRMLRGRLGASALTGLARVLPYVRWERVSQSNAVTDATFIGLTAYVLPRPQLGPVLGKVWMRGNAELQRVPGVTSAGFVLGRDLWSGVRVELGSSWSHTAGTAFSFTLATYLPSVRTLTSVTAPPGGEFLASQYVQGSFLWDRAGGRVATAPGPSVERSGLSGHVFLDENANGRRDPGEPPVPGVRVFVGTASVIADSSGAYRVWDLMPFEPVLVRVDSLSLESPLLVPAIGSMSIQPGPNRFRGLDIPIAMAGVLEGHVVRGEGSGRRGMGGVTLMLTHRRTGQVRRFVTFTDGDFYLMGVTAGEYELQVDPQSLMALAMTSEPFPLTLAPTADGVGRSGLVLVLRPKS